MSTVLPTLWALATSMSRRAHLQRLRLTVLAFALYILKGLAMRKLHPDTPRVISKSGDERITRILNRMTVIKEDYMPTLWAQGGYMQLVALVLWKAHHGRSLAFTRHVVTCEDGQDVALDEYVSPKDTAALPETAPLMLLIHTITGGTADEVEFAQLCFSRGWRPLFLARRAHCGPLTVPKYNIMGCVNDTKQMIERATSLYPSATFVGAYGLSAGSGGVVNYIGQQNADGPVHAAFVGSPGYDISKTFDIADKASPMLSQYLLKGLKGHFLHPHKEVLSTVEAIVKKNENVEVSSKLYEHVEASSTLQEFVSRSAPMAGCKSFEHYLSLHNPMENMAGNQIPCLVMNAQDDPVCLEEIIPYELFRTLGNSVLACTRQGSHIAWREGIFGESCYMNRVAMDFFEAAKKDAEELRAKA